MRILVAGLLVCGAAMAQEEVTGDPAVGRALFSGARRFEKGGPACAACHAMGAEDPLLIASFGPDLVNSKAARDLDVLDGVMADQPYRTMRPLYAGKPISTQERGHVAVFIRSTAGRAPARAGGVFVLAAALIALALGGLLAWGRLGRRSPREDLQRRAR